MPRLPLFRVAPLLFALAACGAHAQSNPLYAGPVTPEQAARCDALAGELAAGCRMVYGAQALRFPEQAQVGAPVKLEMAIHKPPGAGPFPVLVLMHTCAPLAQNPQVRHYAEAGLRAGYAVFIVDSFSQRGIGDSCSARGLGPLQPLRARDGAEAIQYLQRFDWADTKRVAAMGFSQGARVMYWLARPQLTFYAPGQPHYAALVSMYGECYSRTAKQDYVNDHSNVPLLALMGEKDEDGDPHECLPRLERAKAAGAPFEWHVFPGAVHSWDNENMQPWHRAYYPGAPHGEVIHGYDAKVTAEAERMAFDFLARELPAH